MKLPSVNDLDVSKKKVLVRADLDIGEELDKGDDFRLKAILPTIRFLQKNNAGIIIIGHRGRPGGKVDDKYSLLSVVERLRELLGENINHIHDLTGKEAEDRTRSLKGGQIVALMNLRFDRGEEENDEEFAERLASFGQIYVNECFSTSHRKHASFVRLPKILPHAAGLRFIEEVENLSKVREDSKKPVVMIIGGLKKDKLSYLDSFKEFADKILIGGKLSIHLPEDFKDEKTVVARLNQDKEDITVNSIERFEDEICKAGTVIVAGPVGKFEEDGQKLGTQRVLETVTRSSAFKIAGGGDTQSALTLFNLMDKFDWVSVGGGAMLEFLAKGILPGIEALIV
jgi:phosphoglycerate kinase